jgi:hypothetical protein
VYVAKFVGLRSSRMVIPFDQASTTSELQIIILIMQEQLLLLESTMMRA